MSIVDPGSPAVSSVGSPDISPRKPGFITDFVPRMQYSEFKRFPAPDPELEENMRKTRGMTKIWAHDVKELEEWFKNCHGMACFLQYKEDSTGNGCPDFTYSDSLTDIGFPKKEDDRIDKKGVHDLDNRMLIIEKKQDKKDRENNGPRMLVDSKIVHNYEFHAENDYNKESNYKVESIGSMRVLLSDLEIMVIFNSLKKKYDAIWKRYVEKELYDTFIKGYLYEIIFSFPEDPHSIPRRALSICVEKHPNQKPRNWSSEDKSLSFRRLLDPFVLLSSKNQKRFGGKNKTVKKSKRRRKTRRKSIKRKSIKKKTNRRKSIKKKSKSRKRRMR